jgi:hypothetical protein
MTASLEDNRKNDMTCDTRRKYISPIFTIPPSHFIDCDHKCNGDFIVQ